MNFRRQEHQYPSRRAIPEFPGRGTDAHPGRSANIPLDERFGGSRDEDRTLTEGRSAQIPLEERFQSAEDEKGELTPGQSTRISYEERKAGRKQQ